MKSDEKWLNVVGSGEKLGKVGEKVVKSDEKWWKVGQSWKKWGKLEKVGKMEKSGEKCWNVVKSG